MPQWTPATITAVLWALVPLLAFGFAGKRCSALAQKLPLPPRLAVPAIFGVPYLLAGNTYARGNWLVLYFGLPVLVAVLLWRASTFDPVQHGDWRDFAILLVLGLAVDLRWLDPAWPPHLAALGKLILLDAALYGFLAVRQLTDVGFDLRFRKKDFQIGFRELIFYAPFAIVMGFVLGFLHLRLRLPSPGSAAITVLFTFLFIAIPEEIFFRGWIQNLLERRMSRTYALLVTAVIFGLSHFNKRATHFNWRYVLLATIAGIFYGRAWCEQHRVAASAIVHTSVDTIWSFWL